MHTPVLLKLSYIYLALVLLNDSAVNCERSNFFHYVMIIATRPPSPIDDNVFHSNVTGNGSLAFMEGQASYTKDCKLNIFMHFVTRRVESYRMLLCKLILIHHSCGFMNILSFRRVKI